MKLHYKKIFISIFFIFSITNCYSQNDEKIVKKVKINNINKNSKVMKLDRKKLEKYKKNKFKYTDNDSIFKLKDFDKEYKEIKNKIGEKLTTVNVYDKDNLKLIGEGNYIFDFPIGTHTDYDSKGKIIKEKNFDKDFPFSFQKLKQKLLNDFNINIDNIKLDLKINRGLDTSDMKYKYTIILYNEGRLTYRVILIDGITGNTIKDLKNVRALD